MSPRQFGEIVCTGWILTSVLSPRRLSKWVRPSVYAMSATPLTVLVRSFWNFADVFVFIKMYMWFGHYRQIIFSHFFSTYVNLFIFRYLRCNEWLLCERNSFYSISSIFFVKFYKCFVQGLLMWIWLEHHSQSILLTFSTCELSHFFGTSDAMSWCFVSVTPPTILVWSVWYFAGALFMVWRCTCGLEIKVFFTLFPSCKHSHF